MKIKLPDALKKPALTAVENLLEKHAEENFDKYADALLTSLTKLAGSNKIIATFLQDMGNKAKAGAEAALMGALDKIDGVKHEDEVKA